MMEIISNNYTIKQVNENTSYIHNIHRQLFSINQQLKVINDNYYNKNSLSSESLSSNSFHTNQTNLMDQYMEAEHSIFKRKSPSVTTESTSILDSITDESSVQNKKWASQANKLRTQLQLNSINHSIQHIIILTIPYTQ